MSIETVQEKRHRSLIKKCAVWLSPSGVINLFTKEKEKKDYNTYIFIVKDKMANHSLIRCPQCVKMNMDPIL